MAVYASARCKVFDPSWRIPSASLKNAVDAYEASAVSMWHALRNAPSRSQFSDEVYVCEVDLVASGAYDAYRIAVDHMIQNHLAVGEHAYEGIVSCELSSYARKSQHHVQALVLWSSRDQQRLACFEIFASHLCKKGIGKARIQAKLISHREFTRTWHSSVVDYDDGYWVDMADEPASLGPLGATTHKGQKVVDAAGKGLREENDSEDAVLREFLRVDV